jgi:MFS family permease
MGVGAAAVMPTTLSVITTSFPPQERGRAIGVWVGVAGGGAVLGLFASGILLQFFSWSSFFALNVALAVLAIVGTVAVVPPSRDADPAPLDVVGAVLSLVGVSSMVFAIIEGSDRGWRDAATLGSAGVAAVSLAGFVVRQLRTRDPLLDVRLFGIAAVGGALVVVAEAFDWIEGRSAWEVFHGIDVALLVLGLAACALAGVAPGARRAYTVVMRCGHSFCIDELM